jgi:hypothetical protein
MTTFWNPTRCSPPSTDCLVPSWRIAACSRAEHIDDVLRVGGSAGDNRRNRLGANITPKSEGRHVESTTAHVVRRMRARRVVPRPIAKRFCRASRDRALDRVCVCPIRAAARSGDPRRPCTGAFDPAERNASPRRLAGTQRPALSMLVVDSAHSHEVWINSSVQWRMARQCECGQFGSAGSIHAYLHDATGEASSAFQVHLSNVAGVRRGCPFYPP